METIHLEGLTISQDVTFSGRLGPLPPTLTAFVDGDDNGESEALWAAQEVLVPGAAFRMEVGRYRLDAQVAPGDRVGAVEVLVIRDACPESAQWAAGSEPRWFWISSAGIHLHDITLGERALAVALDERGDTPRLDLSSAGYHHTVELTPDGPRVVHLRDHRLVVDTIAGERGEGSIHARLRVDAAAPGDLAEAIAADDGSPCGRPSPRRTRLPKGLARPNELAERHRLRPGESAQLGPLVVTHRRGRPGAPHELKIRGSAGAPAIVRVDDAPRLARVDDSLVHVEPAASHLEVGRLALACPAELVLPQDTGATFVWISTIGRRRLVVGDLAAPGLTLEIRDEIDRATLVAAGERSYLTEALSLQTIGHAFTVGAHLVEIVDVVADLEAQGPTPVLHLQLRLTPGR